MVGWQHQLNGHEFEQAPRAGDGQGSLVSMGLQRVRRYLATEQVSLGTVECYEIGRILKIIYLHYIK